MKHDAIVEQGIPIHERVPIPEDMIPADSRVEIDAKIQAGYCKHEWLPSICPFFCLQKAERVVCVLALIDGS
jgi:hypothetical protein